MQLLAPTVFIALIPLAGIIILLYLLKLRLVPVEIASTFLWRQALQDVQANIPFQKLKRNLLLVLQLLALTALIAGLAAPYVLAERLGGKNTVIVMDASGSMKATDVEGSRFEQARGWARRIISGMGRGDEVAVIVSGARSHVAAAFSSDQRKLVQTVAGLQPTDCATNIKDGLLLAMSLAARRPNAQVYVVSDGAFEPLPEVSGSSNVRFLKVGERNENVAILAFEASRPAGAKEHQLFLRIHNFSKQQKGCLLSLYHDDEIIDAEQISIKPGEDKVQTFGLSLQQTGLLKAEIELQDDLAADNVAYTFAETAGATSVLLVTPGNLFLEQALLILPEVKVDRAEALDAETAATVGEQYDIVVFDRVTPPEDFGGVPALLIREGGEGAGSLASPEISRWENTHPVLAHVNLSAVEISTGRARGRRVRRCWRGPAGLRSSSRATCPGRGRSALASASSTPTCPCASAFRCCCPTSSTGWRRPAPASGRWPYGRGARCASALRRVWSACQSPRPMAAGSRLRWWRGRRPSPVPSRWACVSCRRESSGGGRRWICVAAPSQTSLRRRSCSSAPAGSRA